jgi:hypothetical protein
MLFRGTIILPVVSDGWETWVSLIKDRKMTEVVRKLGADEGIWA